MSSLSDVDMAGRSAIFYTSSFPQQQRPIPQSDHSRDASRGLSQGRTQEGNNEMNGNIPLNPPTRTSPKKTVSKSFARLKHRWDFGSFLCKPVADILPSFVTWVHLCIINHILNWCMFLCVLFHRQTDSNYAFTLLLIAALINLVCSVLDNLASLYIHQRHARSQLAALLDHCCDSMHTPMVAASIAYALGARSWTLAASVTLSTLIFSAQLITYQSTRVFVDTNGAEGRLGGSFMLVLAAVMTAWPQNHPNFMMIRLIFSYLTIYVMASLLRTFLQKFDVHMWKKFLHVTLVHLVPVFLYISGGISCYQFLIIAPFLSFRIMGSYALFSIQSLQYNFHDSLSYWYLGIMLWGFLCCKPIPVTFFANKLPVSVWFEMIGVYNINLWCVQDLIPYLYCLMTIKYNMSRLKKSCLTHKPLEEENMTSNSHINHNNTRTHRNNSINN